MNYAAYRMKKDGSERNYTLCGNAFPTYSAALDDAQRIYEDDPSYMVEVRSLLDETIAPKSSPWGPVQSAKHLADGIWSVSTSGHGGIWLSNDRVAELHEIMGYNYPTFCRDYQWYEEDCDWTIPVIAFGIESHYEDACKQLRMMSKRWLDRTIFRQAHDALVKAGCMLNIEKVQQALIGE